MSLFVQSMIMHGWQLTEESSRFIRFEHGEGASKPSVKIHRPLFSTGQGDPSDTRDSQNIRANFPIFLRWPNS
jgi:hypothetical protein